jgi:DNA mismatch repair ATPase MutS
MHKIETKVTAAQLVRSIARNNGNNYIVYNDRIKTGRSIKVCGWRKMQVSVAKEMLISLGYKVKIREIKYNYKTAYRQNKTVYRIHVYQNQ